MYNAIVRSHLEYTVDANSPNSNADNDNLGKAQSLVARIIIKEPLNVP